MSIFSEKAYESNSIVNTGVSVNDYFKILMAKKQNKMLAEENNTDFVNELPEIKKDKKKSKSEVPEETVETLEEESIMHEEPSKKKKCKKSKKLEEPEDLVNEDDIQVVKGKKFKKNHQDDPVFVEATEEFVDEPQKKKKKKKKKKSKDVDVEEVAITVETIVEVELPSKKKSKKRKADEMSAETTEPSMALPETLPMLNPVSSFNGKNCVYSTNVIQINTTVAQKLASLTVDQFTNSNISNIVGYGLTEEIELKTVQTKMVEDRGKLDKYSLYNMVSSRDKINKKKLFSKLKRPRNSFQVL